MANAYAQCDSGVLSIAAAMLGQAFQRQGLANRTASLEEALSRLDETTQRIALVCLCFVEPLSLSHLRLFCVAARKACPKAKILLCVWRDGAEVSLEEKAGKLRADAVVSSISSALRAALGFAVSSRRSPTPARDPAPGVASLSAETAE